jgi:Concanavalin A-like lectin/glucanases superfamily/Pectate lyase superfamily protein
MFDYKFVFFSICFSLLFSINVFGASGWYDLDYECRREIAITHTTTEELKDFPVFLRILKTDLSGVDSDGDDILITRADGITKVPYEIEDGNLNYFSLWVKTDISTVSSENVLFIYYNNSNISQASEEPNAVWDENFRMVLHGDDNSDVSDSTENSNDATIEGSCSSLTGSNVGNSLNYHNPDNGRGVIAADDSLNFDGAITISVWVDLIDFQVTNYLIRNKWDSSTNGVALSIINTNSSVNYRYGDGTSAVNIIFSLPSSLTTGAFYHIAITDDSTGNISLYLDGTLVETKSVTSSRVYRNAAWEIAAFDGVSKYIDGVLDEIRVSSSARSAEWIKASHKNQVFANQIKGGNFYNLSSEENKTSNSPFIDVTDYSILSNGTDVSTNLQNLLDNSSTAGKILYFPAGTYDIGATITIPTDRSLQGESGSIIKFKATATLGDSMFTCNGDSSTLKDIVIDGNDRAGCGVFVASSKKYITIDNCEIKDIGGELVEYAYGIKLSGVLKNITISNCSIHDVGGYEDGIIGNPPGAHRGIIIWYGSQNILIDNCTFDQIKGFEDGDAIQIYGYSPIKAGNVTIKNCTFNNIYKRAVKAQWVSGIVIEDCTMTSSYNVDYNCPFNAIGIMNCEDVLIINNNISIERVMVALEIFGSSDVTIVENDITVDPDRLYTDRTSGSRPIGLMLGIYLSTALAVENCIVQDNNISCYRNGIHLGAGSIDNDIQYNNVTVVKLPIDIYADVNDNTIDNNILTVE